MAHNIVRTYCDGGSRGNPGPAGYGAVVQKFDAKTKVWTTVHEMKKYLGVATNNQAEYQGLIAALEGALALGADEVECLADSELMIKQMNHEYRVKNEKLAPLFLRAYNLSTSFKRVTYRHVRREFNKEADRLVNQAIDEALTGRR